MNRTEYWENEFAYKRLLEILSDYWLAVPDEYAVKISMDFVNADGESQFKQIIWYNPILSRKGLENDAMPKCEDGDWQKMINKIKERNSEK